MDELSNIIQKMQEAGQVTFEKIPIPLILFPENLETYDYYLRRN
jgi:hypothetical protein